MFKLPDISVFPLIKIVVELKTGDLRTARLEDLFLEKHSSTHVSEKQLVFQGNYYLDKKTHIHVFSLTSGRHKGTHYFAYEL